MRPQSVVAAQAGWWYTVTMGVMPADSSADTAESDALPSGTVGGLVFGRLH